MGSLYIKKGRIMSKREEKIINFFSELLHTGDQEMDVNSAVERSMEIFDEIALVMKEGNQEEQKAIVEALEKVNENIQTQFNAVCKEAGISREEIESMIKDPKNFTPEIWEALQGLQGQVDKTYVNKALHNKPETKRKKSKKQWIPA